jgi:hypothetical protein
MEQSFGAQLLKRENDDNNDLDIYESPLESNIICQDFKTTA